MNARATVDNDYVVSDSGCWIWQGRMDRNGYGKAYDPSMPPKQRVDWAHRVSYRLHKGEIPAGHDIDHTCEVTACINPDHLDAVTRVEHARRTFQRNGKDDRHRTASILRLAGLTYREIGAMLGLAGRGGASDAVKSAIAKGLVNPDDLPAVQRLTEDDREDIRDLYALGVSQSNIAAFYQLHSAHISRICNGLDSGHRKKAS